ncbi:hypothetical protein VE04_08916 [Pseudogymnoascus sp. 24MN13]|nr:hypothetical protein VE04_08916 [Pseudogymnoascus sp. 24MN13]
MHLKVILLGAAALFASAFAAPPVSNDCLPITNYGTVQMGCKLCPAGLTYVGWSSDNCHLGYQCCRGLCCLVGGYYRHKTAHLQSSSEAFSNGTLVTQWACCPRGSGVINVDSVHL